MGARISAHGIDCCLPAAGEEETQIDASGKSSGYPPHQKTTDGVGTREKISKTEGKPPEIFSAADKPPETPLTADVPKRESWEVRLDMVQVLGETTLVEDTPQACSSLRTILRLDPAWQVRRQAAHSLRCLGYSAVRDAENELRSRLQDPERPVRAAAQLALQVHGFDLSELPTDAASNVVLTAEVEEGINGKDAATGSTAASSSQSDGVLTGPPDGKVGNTNGIHYEDGQGSGVVIFTVEIDKEAFKDEGTTRKLGVDLDVTDQRFMQIIGIKDESLMAEWNTCNPTRQLMVGDKVLSVNGITHNSKGMVQEVVEAPVLILELQRLCPVSDAS